MEGVVSYRAGPTLVHSIRDGAKAFDPEVFPGVDAAQREARLARAGQTTIDTEFGVYLLAHDDGQLDLVDTGCGALMGAVGGALPERLKAIGVAAEAVNRILFTHLHGDHCGGALQDGAVVFPNADVVLHVDEAAHWAGKDAPASRVLQAYAGRITTVGDGADLGHGITSWALPGHTPGHMGLRLGAGLVLVADILHSAALQLPDPMLCTIYDVDPDTACASRRMALAEIAGRGLVWSGSHLTGPDKFLTLEAEGAGYRAQALA